MAYNSPPKDDRPSSYLPPSSSIRSYDRPTSYFSPNSSNRLYDQALRSGYRFPVDSVEAEFQRYPDLRDPVEREREKSRIRAEIMAEQIERRRILEEEVRMELMAEREMTMKRWESSRMHHDEAPENREFVHEPPGLRYDASEACGFPYDPSRPGFETGPEIRQSIHDEPSRRRFNAPFEALQYVQEPSRIPQSLGHLEERRLPQSLGHFEERRLPQPLGHLEERRLAQSLGHLEERRLPQSLGHLEERRLPLLPIVPSHPVAGVGRVGVFESVKHHLMLPTTSSLSLRETKPLQPATSNLVFREIKPLQEPGKERILLAKCEASISDPNRKRKVSALGADHHRTSDLEKKPKGRWNCKLCNISTTSEQTLNDHFKGKKHKMMEEEKALAPYKAAFDPNPVKKELSHPNVKNTTKTNSSETSRADVAAMDEKQKSKMNETSSAVVAKVDTKQKAATLVNNKQKSKMNAPVKAQGPSKTLGKDNLIKKFKFWCELCQVGVNSETVLAGHERGRRHLENLEEKMKKNK